MHMINTNEFQYIYIFARSRFVILPRFRLVLSQYHNHE